MLKTLPALDQNAALVVQAKLDRKTKPTGSLGRIEELASRLAAITGMTDLAFTRKVILVAAADHGVTAQGVSLYPSEVTAQMVLNYLGGGAAICVLARQAGARVKIVDAGVNAPAFAPHADLYNLSQGKGTSDFSQGPAMSLAQAKASVDAGASLVAKLIDEKGLDLLALGEMGIGNTTASAALAAALLGLPVDQVTGRGTGVDVDQWQHKVAVIELALKVNRPDASDALDCLSKVGGFEIGVLAGAMLEAAARRVPVVLDGFITGAAALVAARLDGQVKDFLFASHQSQEIGHRAMLEHLGLRPYLNLDLRLGEGSGAALFLPLVDSACAILREMATFESAGVSDKA